MLALACTRPLSNGRVEKDIGFHAHPLRFTGAPVCSWNSAHSLR